MYRKCSIFNIKLSKPYTVLPADILNMPDLLSRLKLDFRRVEGAQGEFRALLLWLKNRTSPEPDRVRAALPQVLEYCRERPLLMAWFRDIYCQCYLNAYGPTMERQPDPLDRFAEILRLGMFCSESIESIAPEIRRSSSSSDLPRSSDPKVSIIIVAWNNWNDTLQCLSSIFSLTRNPTFEVILVDNGSTDMTRDLAPIIADRFPPLRYLRLERNLGFSLGNNAGAEIARGEHLLFLNNDTIILEHDWLGNLASALESHPRIGAVGQFGVIDLEGEAAPPRAFYQAAFFPGITLPVAWISGYCLLSRREAFEAAGRWRGDLYGKAGYEDIHMGYAMRSAGWISAVPPRWVQLFHKIGSTRDNREVKELLKGDGPTPEQKENSFRALFGSRRRRRNYAIGEAEADTTLNIEAA